MERCGAQLRPNPSLERDLKGACFGVSQDWFDHRPLSAALGGTMLMGYWFNTTSGHGYGVTAESRAAAGHWVFRRFALTRAGSFFDAFRPWRMPFSGAGRAAVAASDVRLEPRDRGNLRVPVWPKSGD